MNKLLSIALLSVSIFQSAYSVRYKHPFSEADPIVSKNRAIIQRFITAKHDGFYLKSLPAEVRSMITGYYAGYPISIQNNETQSSLVVARHSSGCTLL